MLCYGRIMVDVHRKCNISYEFAKLIFLSAVAVIRYWVRVFWDTVMFHLVIKNRGRIPASDSFVVKRIAGPGLASDYYYQVSDLLSLVD